MKIRRSILWSCAAIIALLIVLIIGHAKKLNGLSKTTTPSNDTNPPNKIVPPQQSKNVVLGTAEIQQTDPAKANPSISSQMTPQNDAQRGLAVLNDVPIIFDGRVEDQFGNPVVGARIDASVRIYNGSESTVERFVVTSDTKGFFHIDHGKGEALGITPSKEGYVLATPNTYFKYAHMFPDRFSPDSQNPTVIKMWKLQGAEPIVRVDKEYKLPFSNKSFFFDLLTGSVLETGGDLEIVVKRTSGSISKKNPGDWSIELKPVNGGIIESDYHTARVTFEAPADGYQNSYSVQMNRDNSAWFDNIQKVFFVKSRGGRVYSKFNLNFGINREPTDSIWVEFKNVANANSSRNWEADAPDLSAMSAK